MTRCKSLKYEVIKIGGGFIHRTHRSKKNRRPKAKDKNYKSERMKEFLREQGRIL